MCVALATKGAFENKVLFDNQIIIQLNLTTMAKDATPSSKCEE